MEMKDVTVEKKEECIENLKTVFEDMRKFLNILEEDIQSNDLQTQAVAIWIAGNFCEGYSGFVQNIKKLDVKKEDRVNLENEMKDAKIL